MSFRLKVLNSGSKGNCYLLTDESGETLILDAGVKASDIKKALDFDFSNVAGVIITHEHKDHSLSASDLEKYGLDVWHPYLIDGGRDRRTFRKYAIESFSVPHDQTPCCGFYIRHISGFKMLYLTDLSYCPYRFDKLNVDSILIECNYDEDLLNHDLIHLKHKVLGHLNLKNCMKFLDINKSENLKSVTLCHLSNALDIESTISGMKLFLGDNVAVDYADKGKVIEL